MELTASDVSKLLNVPERTVRVWIRADDLPARRVDDDYVFDRGELLEWINARSIEAPAALSPDAASAGLPGLAVALEAGGIHHGVPGADREAALHAVVDRLILPATVDRDFLFGVLLAREQMGSTAVGDGVALPHVRNPIVLHAAPSAVNLCLLERPVDFHALDGEPVRALFTVISPTHAGHLHLLSRIAFALRDADFKAVVQAQRPAADLLAHARRIDELIAQKRSKRA